MRNRRALLSGVAAAATLGFGVVVPVATATETQVDAPFTTSVLNPCNNEIVVLSGYVHQTSQDVIDSGGGAETNNHYNFHDVTGVGDQGNTYRGISVVSQESSGSLKSANVTTGAGDLRLISQGSAVNFDLHDVLHITQAPDGQQVVFFDHIDATCEG